MTAQHVVSGTVLDESNEPLIGVNISEKGTENGTSVIPDFPLLTWRYKARQKWILP